MRLVGWACVVGIACVIIEMLTVLPYLPEVWWTPPEQLRLALLGRFDPRGMGVMHPGLLGWLGIWGHLAAFVWIPLALWRAYQAVRRGVTLESEERVLLALAPILFLLAEALLRLIQRRPGGEFEFLRSEPTELRVGGRIVVRVPR
jgi:hypothetical protein